jgi:hypothetical protein
MTQQVHPTGQPLPSYAPLPGYAPAPYGPPPAGYGMPYGPPPAPRRPRTGVVVAAVAGGVATVAGLGVAALVVFGTPLLDVDEVESEIVRLTEEQATLAPTGVTCPEDVAVESGATFACSATLDGQPVTYTVRQTDDDGNVFIESDDTWVLLEVVQASVGEQVSAEAGGVEVVTSCDGGGHSVLVNGIGTPIPCTVASAEDPTDSVDVVATVDEAGAVSYSAP